MDCGSRKKKREDGDSVLYAWNVSLRTTGESSGGLGAHCAKHSTESNIQSSTQAAAQGNVATDALGQ